ncbi:hypothetical protein SUGI_0516300 [Cryptomeria japonica]|nr:hypothetical protein SUGI_0516300 [Cryptomeria japonica]
MHENDVIFWQGYRAQPLSKKSQPNASYFIIQVFLDGEANSHQRCNTQLWDSSFQFSHPMVDIKLCGGIDYLFSA